MTFGHLSADYDLILAFDQPTCVLLRPDMLECDVMRKGTKQRNTAADQHRDARDRQPLNEPRPQEPLDGQAPIDVDMLNATGSKLRDDLRRSSRHSLHLGSRGGVRERLS